MGGYWIVYKLNPMNLDHAPKFFWAALSLSLMLLTGGLLIVAYRASSVSVEFADAKLNFANDKIEVARIVGTPRTIWRHCSDRIRSFRLPRPTWRRSSPGSIQPVRAATRQRLLSRRLPRCRARYRMWRGHSRRSTKSRP